MKEKQLATNLQTAVANLATQIGEINNYLAVENETPGTKEERNKIACQTLDAETALDYLNLIASKCEGLFARIEKIKDPLIQKSQLLTKKKLMKKGFLSKLKKHLVS